jgi:hypothetical protein
MELDKMQRYTEAMNEWIVKPEPLAQEVLGILPNEDIRIYFALNMLMALTTSPKLAQGIMIGMLLMNMIHMDTIAERESKDLERMLGEVNG